MKRKNIYIDLKLYRRLTITPTETSRILPLNYNDLNILLFLFYFISLANLVLNQHTHTYAPTRKIKIQTIQYRQGRRNSLR